MKKRVLAEVTIECDPPYMPWTRNEEERARLLEKWCRDFNAFIRDHRSQDDVNLSVQKKYEDQCEFCKSIWETVPLCCDKAIEEYEASKVTT